MDPYTILTNEKENKKWNIESTSLYPKVSIVDPSVQFSLPWQQTVFGAIDAFSHIMEFYFQGRREGPTLSIDEILMETIFNTVDVWKEEPHNYNARATLAWSSILVLNGISGSDSMGGDWACHTIEHGINALHPEVAHGAGLAVVFPAWIKYVHLINHDQFLRWAKNVFNKNNVESAILAFKDKYSSWGAPISLRQLGIKKEEIPLIVENVLQAGRIREIGNIKKLDFADLTEILNIAY